MVRSSYPDRSALSKISSVYVWSKAVSLDGGCIDSRGMGIAEARGNIEGMTEKGI
jgi:hypothetical protein